MHGSRFYTRSYIEAKNLCWQFGGEMDMGFQDTSISFTLGNATCNNRYWAPVAQGSLQPDGKYTWLDDRKGKGGVIAESLPWLPSQPNGLHLQQCVEHRNETVENLRLLNDMTCKSRRCSICIMRKSQTYYLRGEISRCLKI